MRAAGRRKQHGAYAHIGRKGVSHPQSEYYHGNWASLGLPHVSAALAALPADEKYPSRHLAQSLPHRLTFTFSLAHFFGTVLQLHAGDVYRHACHFEARDLLSRLLNSGDSAASEDAIAFIQTARSYYGDSGRSRDAKVNNNWLSYDDLMLFLASRPAIPTADHGCRDSLDTQRQTLKKRYRIHAEISKKAAHSFASTFARTKRIPIHSNEEFLCEIKWPKSSEDDPPFVRPMGSLTELAPEWARQYLTKLEETYAKDRLSWDKTIFRIFEPGVRRTEIARAKALGKKPTAVNAYYSWLYSSGGYYGIAPKKHNVLYRALVGQDNRSIRNFRKQGMLRAPTMDSVSTLNSLYATAAKNWEAYHLFCSQHFKNH